MTILYLDQNKWIDLARAHHGKDQDPGMLATLAFLRQETKRGAVIAPLSGIHYMELARIGDPERRARLGTVMWEISGGRTIASYRAMIIHELEQALARRFTHVQPSPFTLISQGVAHAFGIAERIYRIPEIYRSQIASEPELIDAIESAAQELLERAALTGVGPAEITMPQFGVTPQNHAFKSHLETLYQRVSQLPQAQWEDMLYAISMMDIQGPLTNVLQRNHLTLTDLTARGKDDVTQFINELPSRRADLQLHRQVLRNPQLKPKITDLEDWAGLGPATAYCDVVVCEKHFANLLLRSGFHPNAKIITDIRKVPDLLNNSG